MIAQRTCDMDSSSVLAFFEGKTKPTASRAGNHFRFTRLKNSALAAGLSFRAPLKAEVKVTVP